jgi:hypothetical protein
MMPDWINDYYSDVDAMRLEPFVARHTDDVEFRLGSGPLGRGQPMLREAIGGFWSQLNGLTHRPVNLWEWDNTTIFESEIDYEKKDESVVTIPAMTVLERHGELVCSLRIYIDLSPLFA